MDEARKPLRHIKLLNKQEHTSEVHTPLLAAPCSTLDQCGWDLGSNCGSIDDCDIDYT